MKFYQINEIFHVFFTEFSYYDILIITTPEDQFYFKNLLINNKEVVIKNIGTTKL